MGFRKEGQFGDQRTELERLKKCQVVRMGEFQFFDPNELAFFLDHWAEAVTGNGYIPFIITRETHVNHKYLWKSVHVFDLHNYASVHDHKTELSITLPGVTQETLARLPRLNVGISHCATSDTPLHGEVRINVMTGLTDIYEHPDIARILDAMGLELDLHSKPQIVESSFSQRSEMAPPPFSILDEEVVKDLIQVLQIREDWQLSCLSEKHALYVWAVIMLLKKHGYLEEHTNDVENISLYQKRLVTDHNIGVLCYGKRLAKSIYPWREISDFIKSQARTIAQLVNDSDEVIEFRRTYPHIHTQVTIEYTPSEYQTNTVSSFVDFDHMLKKLFPKVVNPEIPPDGTTLGNMPNEHDNLAVYANDNTALIRFYISRSSGLCRNHVMM